MIAKDHGKHLRFPFAGRDILVSATGRNAGKGIGAGDVAPMYGAGGTMQSDHVKVLDRHDSTGNRFYDVIDFSSLAWDTVNSIMLTLGISDARGFLDRRFYGATGGGTRPKLGAAPGSGNPDWSHWRAVVFSRRRWLSASSGSGLAMRGGWPTTSTCIRPA